MADSSATRPVVLKIGGSLAQSDAAARLMRGIAQARPRQLVIVPGGGVFADAVRSEQARHRFSDQAAHHMALLAMHAYGVMLTDFAPGFVLSDSLAGFSAAWRDGVTPIWSPAPMVLAAIDIPASWDVTSDSLAAWLAGAIGAERLILVKSCEIPRGLHDPGALSGAGVVDRAFEYFVRRGEARLSLVSEPDGVLAWLGEESSKPG